MLANSCNKNIDNKTTPIIKTSQLFSIGSNAATVKSNSTSDKGLNLLTVNNRISNLIVIVQEWRENLWQTHEKTANK
jgi:hypothetical protein